MASARALRSGVAAAIAISAGVTALVARGNDERTLSLYNIHNKETLSVVYMRNGKRDPEAMKKINYFMRDWRTNEPTTMDPELIDLMWEVHTELGSRQPIHLVSGFRSPGTNEKLRRGGGGQAKNSRHTVGKAADVHFPDVPAKQIRYSGLIRERGGVGYYPTSGVPFVHLDTGNVRHWPRLPRYELALLFPNGNSKHTPADGRPLTRQDYTVAKSRYQELAQQVAAFFDLRNSPKTATTLIADAGGPAKPPAAWNTAMADGLSDEEAPAPAPTAAAPVAPASIAPASIAPASITPASITKAPPAPRQVAQAKLAEARLASLGPVAAPRLVGEPRRVAAPAGPRPEAARQPEPAPAAVAAGPSHADRNRLAALFDTAATYLAEPKLVKQPARVSDGDRRMALASLTGGSGPAPAPVTMPAAAASEPRLAAVDPAALADPGSPQSLSDVERSGWSTGWAAAPEFDEEHPDEMSYRPFPVAPLLTATSSADDPVLTRMAHPRVAETLELLGKENDELPMRLRPGQQQVALLMAQQFRGAAVDMSALDDMAGDDPIGDLARRVVRTSSR